jgi:ubiquinone/menaquinone biosynthesis C-methylase UbiE
MQGVHPAVAVAAYDSTAGSYERGRPEYPKHAIEWLIEALGLSSESTVLDLAAWTGKLTSHIASSVATVIAVEPIEAFRTSLRRRGFDDVRDGTAHHLTLPDQSVDAVTIGQAFHWFADAGALAEIRRILRPGGRLGLIWNLRPRSPASHKAVDDILRPYRGRVPSFGSGQWRRAFARDALWVDHTVVWDRSVHEATFVARFLSVSVIADLSTADQERV